MNTIQSGTTVAGIAAATESVVEGVMKIEPTVATIASMFIPGAAPIIAMIQPEVLLAAPFVENALKALAAGNNGDVMTAFIQLLQHLTPGQPNTNLLSVPVASAVVTKGPIGTG